MDLEIFIILLELYMKASFLTIKNKEKAAKEMWTELFIQGVNMQARNMALDFSREKMRLFMTDSFIII